MNNELTTLKRKVYITRKSRINMEVRLLKINRLYKFCITVLSFMVFILSILSMLIDVGDMETYLIIFSTAVFVFTLTYNEKILILESTKIRNDYAELDYLYNEMTDEQKYLEYHKKYNEIIKNSQNHSSIDYYNAIYNDGSEDELNWKHNFTRVFVNLALGWLTYILIMLIMFLILFFIIY